MRSFAEEKKAGTLDLLLTRPLSDLQVILGKYLASVALILLSLLPVLVYYISVIALGETSGNLDHGAFWGSFLGLLLLASAYGAVGIFASVVTDNIIVAFLISVFICFLIYTGFDYIGSLFPFGGLGNTIQSFGIDQHYRSISRGVIDSRDIIYFFSLIAVVILSTNLKLASRRW
jgi:ABC-2 type transport system permease protein